MTFKNICRNIKTVLLLLLHAKGNKKYNKTRIYLVRSTLIIRNNEN